MLYDTLLLRSAIITAAMVGGQAFRCIGAKENAASDGYHSVRSLLLRLTLRVAVLCYDFNNCHVEKPYVHVYVARLPFSLQS